jgi:hypothetical protein
MRLPVILAACAAVLTAPALAQDDPDAGLDTAETEVAAQPYVWHAYTVDSIAFGVPGTDDRAVRIDCEAGRMVLRGPVDPEIVDDGKVRLTVWGPGGMDMLEATTAGMGDGLNFVAPLPSPSDALDGLMKGADMTLMLLGEERVVPGAGAPAVLGPLLRRCAG